MLHWTFEHRDGNQIIDVSGNGRHGTLSGGSFVSSPWGEAVSLDGIDDKISLTGPRNPSDYGGTTTGAFTISAHVRVDDVERTNFLCIGCGPFSNMTIGTHNLGPRVLGSIHDPTAAAPNYKTYPTSNQALVDDTWVHVTMVVEAGVGTKFYLNCEFDREVENENVELKDYNYSSVGEGSISGTWYQGEIDDLKIWSRALSAAEIEDLCPCGGAPEAYDLGIEPPIPPSPYEPPEAEPYGDGDGDGDGDPPDAVKVGPSDLQAAVTAGIETIVLEDGVYTADDIDGDWLLIKGQKLWAENLGGAILKFGIDAGGNDCMLHPGPELHGLVFDIEDEDNAPDWPGTAGKTVISGWTFSTEFVIEDCFIHGGPLDTGIWVTSVEGFEARRLEIDHLNRYGILIQNTQSNPSSPMILSDIRIWDIDDPGDDSNGTGIRVGETANLSRIHVRDVRWSGVVINGETNGSTATNIDVDRTGTTQTTGRVGVYFDNTARNVTVSNFCIGPGVSHGFRSEWDHNTTCRGGVHVFTKQQADDCLATNDPGGEFFTRGVNHVVEYGLVEASDIGVLFHRGTVNGDVNNVTFRNYSFAAIAFHDNVSTETLWPLYDDGSSQSDNTFEECGVCELTFDWNGTPCCEDIPSSCDPVSCL